MFLFYTLFDIILLGDTMGFFSKIKNMFKGSENTTEIEEKEESRPLNEEEKKEVKVYEKGLRKSREGFVSKLAELTGRYKNVNDEYFDELEEILIMADIGVNTVMDFVDRLKKRVYSEKIDDPNVLKEIIVDELNPVFFSEGNCCLRRDNLSVVIAIVC